MSAGSFFKGAADGVAAGIKIGQAYKKTDAQKEEELLDDVVSDAMDKPARGGGYENTPEMNTGPEQSSSNMTASGTGRVASSYITPVSGYTRGRG